MNAESFLQSFNAALDAIVQRDFAFTHAQDVLPSGRLLSIGDRLQIVREFNLDRPEFARKVDEQTAAEFDVATEVRQRDEAMENLIQELLGISPTRERLVALGFDKLNAMDAESPHFELRDQLRAGLASNDTARIMQAIRRLPLRSEEFARLIREELAELTGLTHGLRKSQLAHRLESYQEAKSHLAGAWFSTAILCALHYSREAPVRELIIAGLNGLAMGIEKFDSQRGYKFGSYIIWWIRQALTRAAVELRGWTVQEVQIRSDMRKLIGEDRWRQWVRSPHPKDVAELGLADKRVIEIIERGFDKTIYPIHLRGKCLTPDCAASEREWVQLSENVTSETNPLWWV